MRTCGTPFPVWAEIRCDTCGFAKRLPIEMFATGLAMVTGSMDNREMEPHSLSFEAAIDLVRNQFETAVTTEPLRFSITFGGESAAFTITSDGDTNVIERERFRAGVVTK